VRLLSTSKTIKQFRESGFYTRLGKRKQNGQDEAAAAVNDEEITLTEGGAGSGKPGKADDSNDLTKLSKKDLLEIMLKQGLIDEIRSLLDSGIPARCTAMQAIGYKEFVAALEGHISVAEAAAQVQQSSRHYAKRQLTWFRRNPNIHWLRRSKTTGSEEILHLARQLLHETDK
jgi:hypothetical protein